MDLASFFRRGVTTPRENSLFRRCDVRGISKERRPAAFHGGFSAKAICIKQSIKDKIDKCYYRRARALLAAANFGSYAPPSSRRRVDLSRGVIAILLRHPLV